MLCSLSLFCLVYTHLLSTSCVFPPVKPVWLSSGFSFSLSNCPSFQGGSKPLMPSPLCSIPPSLHTADSQSDPKRQFQKLVTWPILEDLHGDGKICIPILKASIFPDFESLLQNAGFRVIVVCLLVFPTGNLLSRLQKWLLKPVFWEMARTV